MKTIKELFPHVSFSVVIASLLYAGVVYNQIWILNILYVFTIILSVPLTIFFGLCVVGVYSKAEKGEDIDTAKIKMDSAVSKTISFLLWLAYPLFWIGFGYIFTGLCFVALMISATVFVASAESLHEAYLANTKSKAVKESDSK